MDRRRQGHLEIPLARPVGGLANRAQHHGTDPDGQVMELPSQSAIKKSGDRKSPHPALQLPTSHDAEP